jgi:hypothetical protein
VTRQLTLKRRLQSIFFALLAVALCSCAATSLKSTWKSPDYHGGPVGKIAVLAMDERGLYRPMIEGQFVRQLEEQGQPAFKTLDLLNLPEIKADKAAAAAKLRAAGANSILIVRLADAVNKSSLAPHVGGGSTVTVESGTAGWFQYYTYYSSGPGGMQKSLQQNVYLETSLYDLNSEQKLWSGLTETILREDMDRRAEVEPLVATLVKALRADGLIR